MLPARLHPNGSRCAMHALAGIDSLQNPKHAAAGVVVNTVVCSQHPFSRLACLAPEPRTSLTDSNAAFASTKHPPTDQKKCKHPLIELSSPQLFSSGDRRLCPVTCVADFARPSSNPLKQACPANSWALTLVVALRGKRTTTTSTTTRLCSKT